MSKINIEQVKSKLTKLGTVLAVKAGTVFSLAMQNKKGFTMQFMVDFHNAIPEVMEEYPVLEVIKITEDHAFIVLAKKVEK